jgi:hypothetical protein
VLTGTLEVECGDDRFQAGPGAFVFPPNAELSAALAANADASQVRAIQLRYGIARS